MAVKYNVIQRINPKDIAAPRKFYAIAQTTGEVTLREIAEQVADISTLSSIDTLAALESFVKVLPQHLLNGRIVRLGDFGSFRLTISSDGADTAEAFNKSLIRNVNLKFRPGNIIATSLKQASYFKEN